MITYNYGNSHSPITLLQMVGDHDLPGIENEIREIHRLTDQEFAFVAVKVENWNHDPGRTVFSNIQNPDCVTAAAPF